MTARSYSQISLYEKCPRQFNYRYNEKLPVEKSTAASRGTEIHQSVEDFLLGNAEVVHPEIEEYQQWFAELKEDGVKSEVAFCLDCDWQPVDWQADTGYIRGYMDALLIDDDGLCVFEFKTGKKYKDHSAQRHLYGMAALILNPEFDEVEVMSVYFDLDETEKVTYPRSMLNTYKYMWMQRIDKLGIDPHFAARPGPYCRWCPFARDQGGPCEFGSR